jgi:hypothetical protein
MEFTLIALGQPPRLPKKITPAMLEALKALMNTGLKDTAYLGAGAGAGLGAGPQIPDVLGSPGSPEYGQPVIPPKLVPQVAPTPAPSGGSPTGGGSLGTGS